MKTSWLPSRTICAWKPDTIGSLITISLEGSRPILITCLSSRGVCFSWLMLLLISRDGTPRARPVAIIPDWLLTTSIAYSSLLLDIVVGAAFMLPWLALARGQHKGCPYNPYDGNWSGAG